MERVSDEWLDEAIPKYSAIDSKSKGANVYLALCELRERRQMEDEKGELVVASTFMAIKTAEILQLLKKAEAGTPPSENAKEAVLPAPVKQVDGVSVETWTVKQWFQKINEELDELKADVMLGTWNIDVSVSKSWCQKENATNVAGEAADTITAITSMLEAMGIDEQQRQAAQRRVNERNRERNRL